MKSLFINRDVLAVAWSLDNEPDQWKPNRGWYRRGDYIFDLTHQSGLFVWASNRAYGVEIRERGGGPRIFGGVTMRSTFGLSLSHWVLSNAISRWVRRHEDPRRSAADILAQAGDPA